MADLKKKKKYGFYVDEENTEYLKDFLAHTPGMGGMSTLIDGYIDVLVDVIKKSGYKPGEKMNPAIMMQVLADGMGKIMGD